MKTDSQTMDESTKTDELICELLADINLEKNHGKTFQTECQLKAQQVDSYNKKLKKVVEAQHSVLTECPDDLSTSFASFLTELALYIVQLIPDYEGQNLSIQHVQSLLIDYKVLQCLPDSKFLLSHRRIQVLIQDNFPNSSLRRFIDLTTDGKDKLFTKTISI